MTRAVGVVCVSMCISWTADGLFCRGGCGVLHQTPPPPASSVLGGGILRSSCGMCRLDREWSSCKDGAHVSMCAHVGMCV